MSPLLIHPVEELIYSGFGMLLAIHQFGFQIQVLGSDGFFHCVNFANHGQGLSCRFLVHAECIKELASGMGPT